MTVPAMITRLQRVLSFGDRHQAGVMARGPAALLPLLAVVLCVVTFSRSVGPSARMGSYGADSASGSAARSTPASIESHAVGQIAPHASKTPVSPPVMPSVGVARPVTQGDVRDLCIHVMTGTVTAQYRISNPSGITGLSSVSVAGFEQTIIGSGPGYVDVRLSSQLWVDTSAPYPVDGAALPSAVRPYLQPSSNIQSDHPEIVDLARRIVAGSWLQAEATEKILVWVQAYVEYDYTYSLPGDALSVLRNRSGQCNGFSNLATALLRAAGIPGRSVSGCATPCGYATGGSGGRHAWVASYYPDVGWVYSEPQSTASYFGPKAFAGGFDQCGLSGTTIEQTLIEGGERFLVALKTPKLSGEPKAYSTSAASVPSYQRRVLDTVPRPIRLMVSLEEPERTLSAHVMDMTCSMNVKWKPSWQAD